MDKSINLPVETRRKIIMQLHKDVTFFQLHKIIDYSLLLGIINVKELNEQDKKELDQMVDDEMAYYNTGKDKAFMMGIIDYF